MKRHLIFPALALLAAIGTSTVAGLSIDPRTEVSDTLAAQAYGGLASCTNIIEGTCSVAGQTNCSGVSCLVTTSGNSNIYGYASGTTYCGMGCCAVATTTAACATATTTTVMPPL